MGAIAAFVWALVVVTRRVPSIDGDPPPRPSRPDFAEHGVRRAAPENDRSRPVDPPSLRTVQQPDPGARLEGTDSAIPLQREIRFEGLDQDPENVEREAVEGAMRVLEQVDLALSEQCRADPDGMTPRECPVDAARFEDVVVHLLNLPSESP